MTMWGYPLCLEINSAGLNGRRRRRRRPLSLKRNFIIETSLRRVAAQRVNTMGAAARTQYVSVNNADRFLKAIKTKGKITY